MTVARQWQLQQAVYGRLAAELVGQGVNGEDVPVYDHIPSDPLRLHVRIDGFSVIPGSASNGHRARHDFSVHVFDDNTGIDTGTGTAEIARIQPIVVAALEDWSPLVGATGITHISSNSAAGEGQLTRQGISRFSTQIGV